jgi:hypothetical protein
VSPRGFGGSGSLNVEVHHVLQIHDALHMHESDSVHVTLDTTDASPSGTATGTVAWTGTAHGEAPPETFQVTADDVPWILWQVLLSLDDMANPTKPGVTVGQVYDRLMPLLSLILALLPLLPR